ncbi:pyridoxamine 5'-phosphate oxidase family protein [Methanobrevibacter sp.]|uniref:pyridoxamine 5'-phosphate oxidase family protein n=1 Tax=Methanobrevibacter sp. TaxID=66852 RepID=UPI0025DC83D2|nr:pyridoxamine 5'-phosphate oxidase family protein [Methanobrevibacter sp.]MBQ2666369.1 pyridoxamine 5'-phosphate oxidase family protein [Methanobrevibacter sp.]MBQ2666938.1 pyridoxamine 5'-phosphate oxidase family protein [Methanobrevibacter sp.]
MRRQGQRLSKEECEEILTNQPRGVLALLGDYDYPYAVPMSHVYENGKIYFHGAKKGHKNDAVRNYSKCSYCVLNEGVKAPDSWWYTFKSVIAFGKIRILTDNDEKIEALTYLGDKFFPTHEETVDEINRLLEKTEVYEITVEHMDGKVVKEK